MNATGVRALHAPESSWRAGSSGQLLTRNPDAPGNFRGSSAIGENPLTCPVSTCRLQSMKIYGLAIVILAESN